MVPESLNEEIRPVKSSSKMGDADSLPRENSAFPASTSSFLPNKISSTPITLIPSPVQLNSIRDLPTTLNIDTVSLRDILGDPLIKECWIFNFLFDVDFVMSQFDQDVRNIVQVRIVHGSWKKDHPNKIRIDQAAKRYSNVQAITAYMPEIYGTHHSKMIILFRHDNLAEVIILTANMIAMDWRMTQAVWRSPLLPLQTLSHDLEPHGSWLPALGIGTRFKHDLLACLSRYDARTKSLVAQISHYDFASVRAALVASTPGRQNLRSLDPETDILWGWPALKRVLDIIPTTSSCPHVVAQVSSVASVGEKWVSNTFFNALSSSAPLNGVKGKPKPQFSIIFPTGDEIRRSVDGYSSGGSIHMKAKSAAQMKQVAYLKPMLCHWAGDGDRESIKSLPPQSSSLSPNPIAPTATKDSIREAGRRRASPHIKTYVRFTDSGMTSIDWAMMTSANLSTQAWGAATNSVGDVRISSYEIGVVVWPALWDSEGRRVAKMVPVFGKDLPDKKQSSDSTVSVGWRMPYDLPLVPYAGDEMPWCNNEPCGEPDWMGRTWPGD